MKLAKQISASASLWIFVMLCLCKTCGGFSRFRRTSRISNDTENFGNCQAVKSFFDSQNITITTSDESLENTDSEYSFVILPLFVDIVLPVRVSHVSRFFFLS